MCGKTPMSHLRLMPKYNVFHIYDHWLHTHFLFHFISHLHHESRLIVVGKVILYCRGMFNMSSRMNLRLIVKTHKTFFDVNITKLSPIVV
jgi:hypothetical protein